MHRRSSEKDPIMRPEEVPKSLSKTRKQRHTPYSFPPPTNHSKDSLMVPSDISSKLQSLFDAHKHTLQVVNRLAELPAEPGAVPEFY